MNKVDMLKISKALINAYLTNGEINLDEKHYFMFSIASFLVLKEQIIKKDINDRSNTKIIYDESSEYTPALLTQYKHLLQTLRYTVDGEKTLEEAYKTVELVNGSDNNELKEAVWCIDRLRDSFAHGKYDFDLDRKVIKVDNRYFTYENGKRIEHIFECEINPELLNWLYQKVNEKEINYVFANFKDGNLFKIYDEELANFISKKHYYKRREQFDALEKLGEPNTFKNKDTDIANRNRESVKLNSSKKDAKLALKQTAQTLGFSSTESDILTILLYNYLLLLLSDDKKEYDYSQLSLLGINYEFKEITDSQQLKDDITNTRSGIKKVLKRFNKSFVKIDEHESTKRYRQLFIKTISDLLKELKKRNEAVISRIRNAVMHGNIEKEVETNNIHLFDDVSGEEQFTCMTNNQGLIDLINELESNKKLTFIELIYEIHKLLVSFELDEEFITKSLMNLYMCAKYAKEDIRQEDNVDDIIRMIEIRSEIERLQLEKAKAELEIERNTESEIRR